MRTISKLFIASVFALATVTSQPVVAKADSREVVCLAKNIYFESRGESLAGKLAVAQVTLNRTKHENFPDTVCGVVYQPHQFSWTAKRRQAIKDSKAWQESLEIARDAINNGLSELRGFSAIYFHSGRKPLDWGRVRLVAKIGKHKFYTA
jgi:spore germination cell wall hydrolase CwlJ-like protein